MVIGEIVRGAIAGAADAFRGGRHSAPQAQLAPANNFIFVPHQGPIAPDYMLAPATAPLQEAIPSTLHVQFVASEEDEDYFTVDQPAVVLAFRLEDDDEVTVGMRLDDQLDLDVAPGWYGVLAIVHMDDDLEDVDGIGFALVPVEDWGYDVDVLVELQEVDEEEADEMMEEIADELADIFA